jgi:hypothetical protein
MWEYDFSSYTLSTYSNFVFVSVLNNGGISYNIFNSFNESIISYTERLHSSVCPCVVKTNMNIQNHSTCGWERRPLYGSHFTVIIRYFSSTDPQKNYFMKELSLFKHCNSEHFVSMAEVLTTSTVNSCCCQSQ